METPEDRFYNPARINGWFGVAAVLTFAACVAVILDDHYDREWKEYQDAFFRMEEARAKDAVGMKTADTQTFPAAAWELADSLMFVDGQPTEDGAPNLGEKPFEAALLRAQREPDFAAGAALAARLYEQAAEAALGDPDLQAAQEELLAQRAAAEDRRFKWEKQQRELQALVDQLKFEKDHAFQQGHAGEAAVLEKQWQDTRAREAEVHARMDDAARDKDAANDALKEKMARSSSLESRSRRLYEAAGVAGAERKLGSLVAYELRNAPLLDPFAPVLQIRQKVFPELKVDYNFAEIGRVDRCMSCHMGIDRIRVVPNPEKPGDPDIVPLHTAENTPEKVFRTHPRPELFVSSVSPHSMDRVGCTVCHGGLGWGLSFNDAYHTPNSPEQEAEWEEKYHWHRGESWTEPMLPMKYVEAGCAKCHRDPVDLAPTEKFAKEIPQAPVWNRGMRLFEDSGCFGCHKVDGFTVRGLDRWVEDLGSEEERQAALALSVRKAGPSLERVKAKWPTKEAALKWVWEPASLRPTTTMPRFFGQPNNSRVDRLTGVDYDLRTRAEAWGMVEYLWANSAPFEPHAPPAGVTGDAARGKDLFGSPKTVGCVACHSTDDFPNPLEGGEENDFGPDLSTVGSKTSFAWLYSWLREPTHYWAETRMPELRLTEQEAADLAAYLASKRDPEWEARTPEPPSDAVLRTLAVEALRATETEAAATEKAEKASRGERLLMVGKRAITRYACYGCHDIKGFEKAERIGTELGGNQGWGSKDVDRLDFGMLEDAEVAERYAAEWGTKPLPHRKPEWAKLKLLNPRVFDAGLTKQPHEKLVMPNFGFTEEEADALVTFLLSQQKEEIPPSTRANLDARERDAEKMKWIVRQYNCYGCHTIDRETAVAGDGSRRLVPRGRDIAPWIGMDLEAQKQWPPTLGGEVDLESSHHPPDIGEGAKVHPDWLYRFLQKPGDMVVRHWLAVRMPEFPFTTQELNALTEGFAAKDGVPYPFVPGREEAVADEVKEEARRLFLAYQCTNCHVLAGSPPPSGLGTDLALARGRLRYDWLKLWLRSPKALQPSSSMPDNWGVDRETGKVTTPLPDYFGGDAQEQIRRMADFVLGLGRPEPGRSGAKE